MREKNRIKREDAVLAVIDFQTRMMPAIKDADSVIAESAKLIRGCRILGVPILVTQQYTKGLGVSEEPIVTAMTENLGEFAPGVEFKYIEKVSFSAMGEPKFVSALEDCKRKSVIICGVEGHVCLRQTVLDLLSDGYSVYVASDCISSRKERDLAPAITEMTEEGAVLITSEAVLFEMLQTAEALFFKQISKLVK